MCDCATCTSIDVYKLTAEQKIKVFQMYLASKGTFTSNSTRDHDERVIKLLFPNGL